MEHNLTDTTLLTQGVSPDANAPADAPNTEAPGEVSQPVQVEIVDKPKLSERDVAEESAAKFQRTRRDEALKANAEPKEESDGRARDEKGRFAPREEKAATGGADGADTSPTASVQAAPPDEPKFKIKVNGREVELPQSEILKRAQLAEAANERFQQAAQLYKQAQAIAQSQNPAGQPAGPSVPTPQGADIAADLARKLSYGTEAEATEAIRALLARSQTSNLDPNQVAMQAAHAAMTQIATQTAIEKIGNDYPDIKADPALTHIANLYWNQVAARDAQMGVRRQPYEVMKEAADLTMAWIGQKKGTQTAASVNADAFAAKNAAKAKAPAAITGTSARSSSGAKSPQTQADIVRAERQARGLSVL